MVNFFRIQTHGSRFAVLKLLPPVRYVLIQCALKTPFKFSTPVENIVEKPAKLLQ